MRDRVVPPPPLPDDDAGGCDHERRLQRQRQHAQPSPSAACDQAEQPSDPPQRHRQPSVPHAPTKNRRPRARYSWAELLRRVFLVDVLVCPHCRGRRTLLAAIFDQGSIHRILAHLGLPTEPPEIAPARPPPVQRLPW
jgi:hypothetical protein